MTISTTTRTKTRERRKRLKKTERNACWLTLLLFCAASVLGAAGKKPDSYSLVAGTVFREPGFALAGVEVTLAPASAVGKGKKLKATSDSRGEFAFRVPPAEAKYTVSVSMKGYSSESKSITVSADQRIDVTFTLVPESK
jgi:hypothetical protein